MQKIKIVYIDTENSVLIPDELINLYQINSAFLTIKVGCWSAEVPITSTNQLEQATIGIPKNLFPFDLPETLTYEIQFSNSILKLGPVIGILNSTESNNTLGKSKRKVLRTRLKSYDKISGLVYVFSLEDLDFEKQIISGYYYQPLGDEEWIKGSFPFPDAIYNRIRLPHNFRKDIIQITGPTLFNSTHFDKYKLWKVCSSNATAVSYVPDSVSYTEPNDFFFMINKYPTIYIKPIRGMQGKGIIVAKKENNHVTFQGSNGDRAICYSIEEIAYYLGQNLTNKFGYILQQGIHSMYKDKKVDFRFYFQKNFEKEWICQGVVGRIANKDSVVTNFKHLSMLLTGKEAIRRLFNVNKKQADKIIESTIEKCRAVCELIDQEIGHYGDLAIDVILDKEKKPYILEINNRIYGTKSLKRLGKSKMFNRIRTTPLAYAKALAGF
ncbi:hypothetical protein JOC85_003900 [Bacillus mesophilus]|uniref:YheC/YheD family protein n=1 Tax=Bacillus mesophilus TaxID=1808955 RepID=A0A6M0QBI2_9BACI|nr:YheC/YheD family protein [Bacillus mesophilus]MBM7663074.1 hypothetical protein [Bacillus mesophilus]NEY73607.1 hypothetical protein [Bacillus mesophilus]